MKSKVNKNKTLHNNWEIFMANRFKFRYIYKSTKILLIPTFRIFFPSNIITCTVQRRVS